MWLSLSAAFEAARERGLRFITGKVLQDQFDGVRDDRSKARSIPRR
jgi:cytosine/adenosine deaminase-related metal-dependent hydrolase